MITVGSEHQTKDVSVKKMIFVSRFNSSGYKKLAFQQAYDPLLFFRWDFISPSLSLFSGNMSQSFRTGTAPYSAPAQCTVQWTSCSLGCAGSYSHRHAPWSWRWLFYSNVEICMISTTCCKHKLHCAAAASNFSRSFLSLPFSLHAWVAASPPCSSTRFPSAIGGRLGAWTDEVRAGAF